MVENHMNQIFKWSHGVVAQWSEFRLFDIGVHGAYSVIERSLFMPKQQYSVRFTDTENDQIAAIAEDCQWSYAQTIRILVCEALQARKETVSE